MQFRQARIGGPPISGGHCASCRLKPSMSSRATICAWGTTARKALTVVPGGWCRSDCCSEKRCWFTTHFGAPAQSSESIGRTDFKSVPPSADDHKKADELVHA